MPSMGYYVARGIWIPVFVILSLLYFLQYAFEFRDKKDLSGNHPERDREKEQKFNIRYVARRLGLVCSLLLIACGVDDQEVFGIYTPSNRIDYFLQYNATSILVIIALSAIYSIMVANLNILKERPQPWVAYSFMLLAITTIICGNVVVIYALGTGQRVPRYVYVYWCAAIFILCIIMFMLHVNPLISKLSRFLKDVTGQTPNIHTNNVFRAIVTLKRFRLLGLAVLACSSAWCIYTASDSLSSAPVVDPNHWPRTALLFPLGQALGLAAVLYYIWAPVGCNPLKGKFLSEFCPRAYKGSGLPTPNRSNASIHPAKPGRSNAATPLTGTIALDPRSDDDGPHTIGYGNNSTMGRKLKVTITKRDTNVTSPTTTDPVITSPNDSPRAVVVHPEEGVDQNDAIIQIVRSSTNQGVSLLEAAETTPVTTSRPSHASHPSLSATTFVQPSTNSSHPSSSRGQENEPIERGVNDVTSPQTISRTAASSQLNLEETESNETNLGSTPHWKIAVDMS